MVNQGPTKSSKLNKLINQAEELGLRVNISHNDTGLLESYSVDIAPDWDDEITAYDQVVKYSQLHVFALRYVGDGKPRAFKLHCTKSDFLVGPSDVSPRVLKYWVAGMADNVERARQYRAQRHAEERT